MATPHEANVINSIKSIFQSSKYSDLTISCGDCKFYVHRAVICPRSPFFAAACDGEFKESKTGIIALPDDDPDTVERMLSYLYTSDYEGGGEQWEGGFCNTRLYAIAEKYDIPLLKQLAKARFTEWAESNWSHRDFPTVVREVYESTPSSDLGLRDTVSHLCGQHVKEIINKDEFLNLADLFGELGLGVLKWVLKDTEEAEKAFLEERAALHRKLDFTRAKLGELTMRMGIEMGVR